ncbi:MAG: NADH-quinone oxidoreductase subunit L [Chloroflexi bacterium]|nr:NADH-quinone oxidoreductase subunit L [Chloroflexota bacterium]
MNFDANDMNFLPWLIPAAPLLAFFVIVLITNRARWLPGTAHEYSGDGQHPHYHGLLVPVVTDWGRVASIVVGMSGVVAAWLMSLVVVSNALGPNIELGKDVFASSIAWLATGQTTFSMRVMIDPLTTVMLVMVPLACTMIFIYSIGYMAHDPRQARFFALISLFAAAMLTLVVADNLLLLFVGWEVMGLCSYLLIGFWYEKDSAYQAAIKAFTTTRVADVVMLLGIAYLYTQTGTLSFREILYNEEVLHQLASTPALLIGSWGVSAAGLIGVFLIIGTVGKSAQFPLHVWLPDAMEGPTPVSAMIHAAAMVSAGIYAVIRMYPLFAAGGHPHQGDLTLPLMFMAVVGAVTALFAATIAVAQNDVKRVLAYSTISQLGFMMAALGIGGYVAATFHLITHAFFKALLFMASGAVIHGVEHGHQHGQGHGHNGHGHDDQGHEAHDSHDVQAEHGHEAHGHGHGGERPDAGLPDHSFDPQDMLNMGGMRKTMPVTFWTFLIGGLSLAGLPLVTAGFWSKDEILADAWYGLSHGYGAHTLVFVCLVLAATMTAFYTMRQLGLTFWGEPRTAAAKHAGLPVGPVSVSMTLPLIILAVLAVIAGYVGVHPDFPLFGALFSSNGNPFFNFVGPTLLEKPEKLAFDWVPVFFSFAAALGGIAVGYWVYWRKPLEAGQEDPAIKALGPVYDLLKNKYYFDELYERVFIRPSQWFATAVVSEFVDHGIIDGFLHLLARLANWIGEFFKALNLWLIDGVGDGIPKLIGDFGFWFRRIQTGRVQQYLLLVLIAALLIGVIFAISAGLLQAAG